VGPSKNNADNTISCGERGQQSEIILQDANGNGQPIHHSQYLGETSNGNAMPAQQETSNGNATPAQQETSNGKASHAEQYSDRSSHANSSGKKRQLEEDKFQEM